MRTSKSLVARGSLVKKLRMRRASGTWKNAMDSMGGGNVGVGREFR
jgi:hypothetical protein